MPTEISSIVRLGNARTSTRADDGRAAKPVEEVRQELPSGGKELPPEDGRTADISAEQVDKIVENLNHKVQDIRRELHFTFNAESGRTVISVVDSETKEIIRQIPPEEVVSLAEHFNEHSGLLMSAKV